LRLRLCPFALNSDPVRRAAEGEAVMGRLSGRSAERSNYQSQSKGNNSKQHGEDWRRSFFRAQKKHSPDYFMEQFRHPKRQKRKPHQCSPNY
jgi:hypothetical protein